MDAIPMNLVYFLLAECFYRLKLSESWRGLQKTAEAFSKEDKEALNALVALVLIPIFREEYGIVCDVENLARHILYRIFKKAFLWDSKPQNKWFLEQKIDFAKVSKVYVKKCLRNMAREYRASENYQAACDLVTGVLSRTNEQYRNSFSCSLLESHPATEKEIDQIADWICDDLAQVDPSVEILYDAAKHLATVIEYEEVRSNLRADAAEEIEKSVFNHLEKFHRYPVVYAIAVGAGEFGKVKKLLQSFSWARYTVRWQGYRMPIRCPILTHMLETALLGYLSAFEKMQAASTDSEREALKRLMEKAFKVGLFHDIAEIWTDDIPSPAKDGMGIRSYAEEQELQALEERFYTCLPKYVADFFRDGVMLEDTKDQREKRFYKAADYFSADLEVWWNLRAGATDRRLLRILQRSLQEHRSAGELTAIQYFLLELEGAKIHL